MKHNRQGVNLSIIGPNGNVQVNYNFARPVKTAHATDAVNGSAVSENQSDKQDGSQLLDLLKIKINDWRKEGDPCYLA